MDEPNLKRASLLLAMETSGDVCGVAVRRDGQFVAERSFRHGMHLSERLFDHVQGVLRDADATLDDVTAFAVGIGPGSFTGTRIGVMTMKTLAVVRRRPLYGINSLEALAAAYQGITVVVVVPLLPCRTRIVFAGAYTVKEWTPHTLIAPAALTLDELSGQIAEVESRHIVLCGPAMAKYGDELRTKLMACGKQVSLGEADLPRADEVARLAYARLEAGNEGDDPLELVPLYLAPPPISQPKPENRPPIGGSEAN